jgi:hypothetical protein
MGKEGRLEHKHEILFKKIIKAKRAVGVAQVEHLSGKCKTLSSNPTTTKKNLFLI